ncbi:hypothetical protein AVT69_gp313 [Pseudomonas phage PhiPA3]|uniref:Uncharacterized protein 315 n=1 Tax=Pseudomonas phage PhiPA3 TaxID=998086 RepID=F8SJF1_BPPA3|nr:hypothetical protein AVT69_gp313 [Pseudomonas phage PhiPA3]AEH03738.1 hypothetical protein [Pseudomonas phage PhiPA3]
MAILSLVQAGEQLAANEIAPFEADINNYLSQPTTVDFLNNPDQEVHFVFRTYKGVKIAQASVDALKAAIEAAGWKSVEVTLVGDVLDVKFYVEEQTAEPEPPVSGGDEGGEPDPAPTE